jgi:TPP-dependent pyruvate/acetoin dehydrogenase alpha subunit
MFDAQSYRSKDEIAAWREKDPILPLRRWLEQAGQVHAEEVARLEGEIAAELDDAVAFAEAGTLEPVEDLERFVTLDSVPS